MLPLPWAVAAFFVLTAVMWAAAWSWTRRPRPLVPSYLTIAAPQADFRQTFARYSP
jgi:hypothetical protein